MRRTPTSLAISLLAAAIGASLFHASAQAQDAAGADPGAAKTLDAVSVTGSFQKSLENGAGRQARRHAHDRRHLVPGHRQVPGREHRRGHPAHSRCADLQHQRPRFDHQHPRPGLAVRGHHHQRSGDQERQLHRRFPLRHHPARGGRLDRGDQVADRGHGRRRPVGHGQHQHHQAAGLQGAQGAGVGQGAVRRIRRRRAHAQGGGHLHRPVQDGRRRRAGRVPQRRLPEAQGPRRLSVDRPLVHPGHAGGHALHSTSPALSLDPARDRPQDVQRRPAVEGQRPVRDQPDHAVLAGQDRQRHESAGLFLRPQLPDRAADPGPDRDPGVGVQLLAGEQPPARAPRPQHPADHLGRQVEGRGLDLLRRGQLHRGQDRRGRARGDPGPPADLDHLRFLQPRCDLAGHRRRPDRHQAPGTSATWCATSIPTARSARCRTRSGRCSSTPSATWA